MTGANFCPHMKLTHRAFFDDLSSLNRNEMNVIPLPNCHEMSKEERPCTSHYASVIPKCLNMNRAASYRKQMKFASSGKGKRNLNQTSPLKKSKDKRHTT